MINVFAFIGSTLLLALLGAIPVYLLLKDKALASTLGLPVGALINTFGILILTILHIPLGLTSVLITNLIAFLILLISIQPLLKTKNEVCTEYQSSVRIPKIFILLSSIIIAVTALYGTSHALLPTMHYDALTNWNMRSKVSYIRAEVVLEDLGNLVGKPQYPFLYHGLQISVMEALPSWNDTAANAVHLLLSVSSFSAVFLLLSRLRDTAFSLVMLGLGLGIPLMTLHMGQSYADSTLTQYSLLSMLLYVLFRANGNVRYLYMSGLMVSACVWTKSDGLFFCLIPWLVVCVLHVLRHKADIRHAMYPIATGFLLSALWPLFVFVKGLSLTPHGASDTGIALTIDSILVYSSALFAGCSFGILWYTIFAVLLWMIVATKLGRYTPDKSALPALLWSLLVFLGYSGVYLLTENSQYLIIGQSFDRQMLMPAFLLVVSLGLCLTPKES